MRILETIATFIITLVVIIAVFWFAKTMIEQVIIEWKERKKTYNPKEWRKNSTYGVILYSVLATLAIAFGIVAIAALVKFIFL